MCFEFAGAFCRVFDAQQNTGSSSRRKAIEIGCERIGAANLSLDVSRSFATLT
jgi:hypothetical protein